MLYYVCEDNQTTASIKHRYLLIWLLKTLLQLDSNSLVIKQKQKQTAKHNIWTLSFRTRLQDWVFCAVYRHQNDLPDISLIRKLLATKLIFKSMFRRLSWVIIYIDNGWYWYNAVSYRIVSSVLGSCHQGDSRFGAKSGVQCGCNWLSLCWSVIRNVY